MAPFTHRIIWLLYVKKRRCCVYLTLIITLYDDGCGCFGKNGISWWFFRRQYTRSNSRYIIWQKYWIFSGTRINRWFSGLNVVNEAQNGRLKKVVFFKKVRSGRKSKSLVDPASNHMLVSKTKPCMSKSELCLTRRDRGRLIKSVVVQMGQFILLG